MRKIITAVLENDEHFSHDNHVDHEAVDFEAFFLPNQVSVKLFGRVYTQETNNNDTHSYHVIGWWNLIDVLQEKDR